jgi:hypothetical protein
MVARFDRLGDIEQREQTGREVIGDVIEVRFCQDGRGPLYHRGDKVVVSDEDMRRGKPTRTPP